MSKPEAVGSFVLYCALFVSAIYGWHWFRAPTHQRNALARGIIEKDLVILTKDEEIERLQAKIADREVNDAHEIVLRSALQQAKDYVQRGQEVVFKSPHDLDAIAGHFPLIGDDLTTWNDVAKGRNLIDELLDFQLKKRLEEEGLDGPSFAYAGFRVLLSAVKYVAWIGKLDDGYTVVWRPEDDHPDLFLQNGTCIAILDETKMEMVRDNCIIRIQRFVDNMLEWPEMRMFADRNSIQLYQETCNRLIAELDARLIQHGYKIGNGCPQCPQL